MLLVGFIIFGFILLLCLIILNLYIGGLLFLLCLLCRILAERVQIQLNTQQGDEMKHFRARGPTRAHFKSGIRIVRIRLIFGPARCV
jgi:hypothetical protein